jgi:uncharacterized membrane protein
MASENTPNTVPAGKGRLVKWVLALSLALNLVIIGLVAGAAMRFSGAHDEGRFRGPAEHSYGAPFVRALPREAKRELQRSLRAQAPQLPSRAERRASYGQMVQVLRQEPFDPAQAQAIFEQQSNAAQSLRDRAQTAWLELVSAMSPAERAEVAQRLEQGLERGPERGPQKWRDKKQDHD